MPGRNALRIIALWFLFFWISDSFAQTGDVTPQQFQTPNCNFQIEALIQHPSCPGDSDGRIELSQIDDGGPQQILSYNWYTVGPQPANQPIVDNLPADIYPCEITGQNGCVDTLFFELIDPTPIDPIRNNATLCAGQQNVNLLTAITGGAPPYSYSYNSSIGVSCVGCQTSDVSLNESATFSLTISDSNGCTATENIFITVLDPISLEITTDPETCGSDGNINITATGGGNNYSYTVDGQPYQPVNVTGQLSAGDHLVVVQDNQGCSASQVVNVPLAQLAVDFTSSLTNVGCFGEATGSIQVTDNEGTLTGYSLDGTDFFGPQPNFNQLHAGTYTVFVQDGNGCITEEVVTITQPDELVFSTLVDSVTCPNGADGIITVQASGGTVGYEYAINQGSFQDSETFENLTPGIYEIAVQDGNGCMTFNNYVVAEPEEPVIQVNKQAPSCPGEADAEIVVIVSGGGVNDSYLYSLNGTAFQQANVFQALDEGIYTAYIQNQNGCVTTENFTIEDPNTPTIDLLTEDATCPSGDDASIVVIVSGGGVYEYSLDGIIYQPSNTFDGLQQGTYQIYAQSATGCVFSAITLLDEPEEPIIDVNKEEVSCPGENDASIVVIVSGGGISNSYGYSLDGISYQSDSSFSDLAAGAYTVYTQNQSGCITTQNFLIEEPVTPDINFIKEDATCPDGNDASIVVIVSGGGVTDNDYSLNGIDYQPDSTFSGLSAGSYQAFVQDPNGCVFTEIVTISEPAEPIIDVDKEDVTCPGGNDASIVVIVSGGGAADTYQYSIDGITFQPENEFLNLTEGNYTVYIQNQNGCQTTQIFNIQEPNVPNINLIENDVTCPGGNNASIVVIVSGGGATQYQYSLNGQIYQPDNSFQNLSANSYTVYIQDTSGCVFMSNALIEEPEEPTIDINVSGSTCSGGNDASIVVIVSGGGVNDSYVYSLDGISYQSNNSFTGLTTGNYTSFIQNQNGCISTENFNIQQTQAPNISYNIQDVTCPEGNDASIVVIVSGGGATSYEYSLDAIIYQPSNTFGGLSAGAYTGFVRDNFGCVTSEPFAIQEPPAPSLTVNVTENNCPGDSDASIVVIVSGGGIGDSYLYSIDGSSYQPGNSFSGLNEGVYTAYTQNQNGCVTTEIFSIQDPSAPNLSFNITAPTCPEGNDASIVVVVSGGGLTPFEYALNGGQYQSSNSFNGLTAGVYQLTVRDANLCTFNGSAVIIDPPNANVNIITEDPTCFGGSDGNIIINVSGGTSGDTYTYSIDGTAYQQGNLFTELGSGNYTAYVQNQNGCIATSTFSLIDPEAPDIQFVIDHVICPGEANGQIIVIITNEPPNNFQFSLDGILYEDTNVFAGLDGGAYTIYVKDLNDCITSETTFVNENSSPALSVSTTDPSCFDGDDGDALIIAVGGSGGFEYSLDGIVYTTENQFPDLSEGIYEAFVKDLYNCVFTEFFQINEPTSPDITHNKTDISCYSGDDGMIEINITGGTPPYEYSLDGSSYYGSNIFSGLTAGPYTSHVRDANSCTYSNALNLNEPGDFFLDYSTQSASCGFSNGLAVCTASGATPPYYYIWEGGQVGPIASGLSSGFHSLTITDLNFCERVDSVFISNDDGPDADEFIIDVSCFGDADGSIDLTMTGGTAPYTYSWSLGMTTEDIAGLAAGNYKVVIIDANNCVTLLEYVVNEPEEIILTGEISDANGFATINLEVVGGSLPYSYLWSTGYTDQDPVNLTSGNYTVTVTDFHGCEETADFNVIITDVDPPRPDISISIFPNPTDGFVEVEFDLPGNGNVRIDLFSIIGQEIYKDIRVPVTEGHFKIDLTHLASAIYLLRFEWEEKVVVEKILKE